MKTKSVLAALLALSSCFSIAIPSSAQTTQQNSASSRRIAFSFVVPDDVDDMIRKSDLVLIGQSEQSLEEAASRLERAPDGLPMGMTSVFKVKVRKMFKGNPRMKTVRVAQSIGIRKDRQGKRYIDRPDAIVQPLKKGARYLLFLKKGNGINAYFPAGMYYGKHNLDGKDTEENTINDPKFREIQKIVRQRFKED